MIPTIRPEVVADHDAIARVVSSAFGSEAEAVLIAAIRASAEYIADLALVAIVDDEIVGHVMISGATLGRASDDSDGDRDIAMLSPLAVSPTHQKQGVGSALVRAAVALADARGEPFVVLEGDPAYYRRFGFEDSRTHGITIPLPDWAALDCGQVLRLTNDDPGLRGNVVYPSAFDGL